ncbi:MAG: hypothetical protein ACREBB_11235 [Nitrosotalea sp.]
MSLTTFLKIPEVRERFKTDFPFETPTLSEILKASPLTKNYSIVGTAFDYLLRFHLKRINPKSISRKWVAESAVNIWENSAFQFSHIFDEIENFEKGDSMKTLLEGAKKAYDDYLNTGKLNDDIIKASIMLAQIDVFRRAGKIIPDLGSVKNDDITDLRNLISLVKPAFFKSKKTMILNPTFGKGSELVGGADADLVIDDTLIDIKTTKDPKFKKEYYFQLIGYYVLYRIGGIDGVKDSKIKNIAVYFSRHGVFYKIPVSSLVTNPKFDQFMEWFKKEACKNSETITEYCHYEYMKMIQEKLSGTDKEAYTLRKTMYKLYRVKISDLPTMDEIEILYTNIMKRSKISVKKIFGHLEFRDPKYPVEAHSKFMIYMIFRLKSKKTVKVQN